MGTHTEHVKVQVSSPKPTRLSGLNETLKTLDKIERRIRAVQREADRFMGVQGKGRARRKGAAASMEVAGGRVKAKLKSGTEIKMRIPASRIAATLDRRTKIHLVVPGSRIKAALHGHVKGVGHVGGAPAAGAAAGAAAGHPARTIPMPHGVRTGLAPGWVQTTATNKKGKTTHTITEQLDDGLTRTRTYNDKWEKQAEQVRDSEKERLRANAKWEAEQKKLLDQEEKATKRTNDQLNKNRQQRIKQDRILDAEEKAAQQAGAWERGRGNMAARGWTVGDTVEGTDARGRKVRTEKFHRDRGGKRQEMQAQTLFDPSTGKATAVSFRRATKEIKQAGLAQRDFFTNTAHVTKWAASVGVLYGSLRLARAGVEQMVESGYQVARLDQVFRGVGGSAQKLADDVGALATAQGRSREEALESAIAWARLGLTRSEVNQAVEVSLKAANVAEVEAADATEHLQAIYQTYNLTVADLHGTLGQLNHISNTYNVTVKELFAGLSRTAAVASQAGLSLNELIGIMGGVVGATKNTGKEVGNALKSIMVQIAKPEVQQLLKGRFGFSTKDAMGDMKGMSRIFREMFVLYQDLTDAERSLLRVRVANKTQAARFQAMMDNYVRTQRLAVDAALNLNSAEEENAKIVATMKSQLQGLVAEFENLSAAMMRPAAAGANFGSFGTMLTKLTTTAKHLISFLDLPGINTALQVLIGTLAMLALKAALVKTKVIEAGAGLRGLGASAWTAVGGIRGLTLALGKFALIFIAIEGVLWLFNKAVEAAGSGFDAAANKMDGLNQAFSDNKSRIDAATRSLHLYRTLLQALPDMDEKARRKAGRELSLMPGQFRPGEATIDAVNRGDVAAATPGLQAMIEKSRAAQSRSRGSALLLNKEAIRTGESTLQRITDPKERASMEAKLNEHYQQQAALKQSITDEMLAQVRLSDKLRAAIDHVAGALRGVNALGGSLPGSGAMGQWSNARFGASTRMAYLTQLKEQRRDAAVESAKEERPELEAKLAEAQGRLKKWQDYRYTIEHVRHGTIYSATRRRAKNEGLRAASSDIDDLTEQLATNAQLAKGIGVPDSDEYVAAEKELNELRQQRAWPVQQDRIGIESGLGQRRLAAQSVGLHATQTAAMTAWNGLAAGSMPSGSTGQQRIDEIGGQLGQLQSAYEARLAITQREFEIARQINEERLRGVKEWKREIMGADIETILRKLGAHQLEQNLPTGGFFAMSAGMRQALMKGQTGRFNPNLMDLRQESADNAAEQARMGDLHGDLDLIRTRMNTLMDELSALLVGKIAPSGEGLSTMAIAASEASGALSSLTASAATAAAALRAIKPVSENEPPIAHIDTGTAPGLVT